MAVSAAVGRVLRACVRGEPTDSLEPRAASRRSDLRGLADAAWFHGVAGYAHARLRSEDWVPADELAALEQLRNGAVGGHLRALASLAEMRALLDPAGIDWLVVKGPVLAEELHGSPALRAYSDLDVMVPARQFERAVEALADGGARPLVRSWAALRRELGGELQVRVPGGAVADLHWHPLSHRTVRDAFRVRSSELFAGARAVDVAGAPVRTLDPVDTLLHLCAHTMLSGGNRLVWLKDIERAVSRGSPDWGRVCARASQWRAQLVASAALDLARRVVGAPVPGAVIAALGGAGGWRALVGAATRVVPVERAGPGGSVGRIVCRATRSTPAESYRELARRSRAFLRERASSPGGAGGQSARDHTDPSAESAARRAYFDAVASSPHA